MRARVGALFGAVLAACLSPDAPTGTARASLALQGTADTIRFEVPAIAQRCADGGGVLVTGARQGQGILLLLRSAGAPIDTGTYELLTRADSTASRGAIVAIRYSVGPVSHGLTVDDGSAMVTEALPSLTAEVLGRGAEAGTGAQRTAEVTVRHVPLAADSAFCRVQP